ncbi:MAG: Dabb family protein [Acidobacteria bacterium]|nr:Dabb family protein [Acidobacteriota bacterium]
MIQHVVLGKFKPQAEAHERRQALDDLRQLPNKIAVIRRYEVGEDVLHSPRSWDFAIVSAFDDWDALQTYLRHDDHVVVAQRLQALCEAIAVVDSEQ